MTSLNYFRKMHNKTIKYYNNIIDNFLIQMDLYFHKNCTKRNEGRDSSYQYLTLH